MQNPTGIGSLLDQSVKHVKEHGKYLLPLVLAMSIVSVIPGLFSSYLNLSEVSNEQVLLLVLISLGSVLVSVVLMAALIIRCHELMHGGFSDGDIINGLKRIPSMLIASLILCIIFMALYMLGVFAYTFLSMQVAMKTLSMTQFFWLLGATGLVLMFLIITIIVKSLMFLPAICIDRKGPFASLRYSWQLVRGVQHIMQVLAIPALATLFGFCLFTLLAVVPFVLYIYLEATQASVPALLARHSTSLVFMVGTNLFSYPAMVVMYNHLKQNNART